MASYAPSTHAPAPSTHEAPSDPLDLFRGLALALPSCLLLWIAIFRAACWLWRG
jgi:hypothetical protein